MGVLGINLDWRMHECSDGQRKKVRIMLKLLRPFKLCVIDEFAADLDIFTEDNQCLTDVIMASQASEREENHHESEKNSGATSKNAGYEAGRVARSLAMEDMKAQSEKRAKARIYAHIETGVMAPD